MTVANLPRPAPDLGPRTQNLAAAVARLAILGDELERALRAYGWTGEPGSCTECPVARLLKNMTGLDVSVGPESATTFDPGSARWQEIPLPATVCRFIAEFDKGYFPGLIDPAGVA